MILRNGKPTAVILDIQEYQKILERLEEIEDLRTLKKMRSGRLSFRRLEEFLREYQPRV